MDFGGKEMKCRWCKKTLLDNEVVFEKPRLHFCNLAHAKRFLNKESEKK